MTSPVGRIYATALTLFTFFLTWALIAAHPWPSKAAASPDPRLRALAAREQKLRRESIATQRIVKRRWAAYRQAACAAQRADRRRQAGACARSRRPIGSDRQPAGRHGHELVMTRRRFKAMGTDVELIVEADRADGAARRR